MLGTIDTAVLSACASETDEEVGESAFEIPLDMEVHNLVDAVEECENLAVLFEEVDDWLVESGEVPVLFVSSGVVGATAVEHISTSVA